jgi:hypothetical protein
MAALRLAGRGYRLIVTAGLNTLPGKAQVACW